MGDEPVVPDVLLDTHVLLWWRSGSGRLLKHQTRLLTELEESGEPVGIASITLWELAKMAERGRLEVEQPLDLWLREIEQNPLISVYPISASIALESARLGAGFHKDPADQIIVATARCHGLRLITADERIRRWGKVQLV
jgi:PIN domain nuclease of toxin-antitoxin system